MLAVDDLAFGFGARRVGSDVTFALDPGETLAVLGGNGAGKTTLFRTLLGLLPAQAGSVLVNGDRVDALAPGERARRLAYVPQQHVPAFGFTVLEAVLMGRAARLPTFARPGAADRAAAFGALERLGIAALAGRPVTELSGGERQLVLVARALAQEASIVLLDEPTASLDIGHQQQALDLLDALRATDGLTLVAAMHDLTLAAQYADRVLLLDAGRVVADGVPAEVLTEEALAEHYGARVRVIELDGGLAVLPARAAR